MLGVVTVEVMVCVDRETGIVRRLIWFQYVVIEDSHGPVGCTASWMMSWLLKCFIYRILLLTQCVEFVCLMGRESTER